MKLELGPRSATAMLPALLDATRARDQGHGVMIARAVLVSALAGVFALGANWVGETLTG
jgi:hypothetical protein